MYAIIDTVTLELVKGSVVVNQVIEERSTARFTVADTTGTASFVRGEPVALYDSDDTLIFGGIIDTPEMTAMAPGGGLYHRLSCIDWHYLADKRLVIATYTATDADVIVTALHTDYLNAEGVTIGNIQAGPELVEVVFNYIPVSEALDSMAEASGFTWFIDEQKQLFFVDRTTYAAPWNWSVTTPKPENSSPVLSSGNPKYRNRQFIRGGTGLTTERTEDREGDGTNTTFVMSYPLGTVPEVKEDAGPALTIGIWGIDAGKDYYWNKGSKEVIADTAPANGVIVHVKYKGQYPLISLAVDSGERLARQAIEGGTGIVENLLDEGWHESGASSQESASASLLTYARDASKYTYSTTDSGIRPGQLQTVDYPLLGLNSTSMLIESVRMTSRGANYEVYDVTAIVGPIEGSWAKFFSEIFRRQAASIRIGDQTLVVLLQQAETLDLVEAPTYWYQAQGQYCWAPKTNGGALRELRWDFGSWG